jgi:hypothetical protein
MQQPIVLVGIGILELGIADRDIGGDRLEGNRDRRRGRGGLAAGVPQQKRKRTPAKRKTPKLDHAVHPADYFAAV